MKNNHNTQTIQRPSKNPEIAFLDQIQLCPSCNFQIGVLAGSLDAICHNCGFKDPCCE